VRASLGSRYGDRTDATVPESVADADHGVVTDRRADVFRPSRE
jgi:adenosylcobinamide hydrolase